MGNSVRAQTFARNHFVSWLQVETVYGSTHGHNKFFFPNAISYIYISLGCSEEMKKQNIRERERERERET